MTRLPSHGIGSAIFSRLAWEGSDNRGARREAVLTMFYLGVIDGYALFSIDVPSDSCLWDRKEKPSYPPNRE